MAQQVQHIGAGTRRRQFKQSRKAADKRADRPKELFKAESIQMIKLCLGLYKVENDQLKKIESWTTTYTASEDCLVSFYTDGYENTASIPVHSGR